MKFRIWGVCLQVLVLTGLQIIYLDSSHAKSGKWTIKSYSYVLENGKKIIGDLDTFVVGGGRLLEYWNLGSKVYFSASCTGNRRNINVSLTISKEVFKKSRVFIFENDLFEKIEATSKTDMNKEWPGVDIPAIEFNLNGKTISRNNNVKLLDIIASAKRRIFVSTIGHQKEISANGSTAKANAFLSQCENIWVKNNIPVKSD